MKKLAVFLLIASLLLPLIPGVFAEEITCVEITKEIIVRSKAGYDGDRIDVGKTGMQYEYVGEENGWYAVLVKHDTLGYIPKNFGKLVTVKVEKTAEAEVTATPEPKKTEQNTETGMPAADQNAEAETVETPEPVSLKRIQFVDEEVTIPIAATWIMQVRIEPEQFTIMDVVWSSSDEKVAVVDQYGFVTGKGEGTAKITATSADNKKVRASATVNVETFDYLLERRERVKIGGYTLKSGHYELHYSNQTGNVKVLSKDASMALVDRSGINPVYVEVLPVRPGPDTVTVTANGESIDIKVFVSQNAFLKDIMPASWWYGFGLKKASESLWEDALNAFEQAGSYADSREQIKNVMYEQAVALFRQKKYKAAYELFRQIEDYRDAAQYIRDYLALDESEKTACSVGDTVYWGSYEQDNDPKNGKEPIAWIVLDCDSENGRVLLLSKYALDSQPYHSEAEEITWENCSLRTWLNDTFITEAFTEDERSAILLTHLENNLQPRPSGWDTDGGNDTEDRVFALSDSEAWQYFATNEERICSPTDYAIAQGAAVNTAMDGKVICVWWLRSPGSSNASATAVVFNGNGQGGYVMIPGGTVRPAMWLDLKALQE